MEASVFFPGWVNLIATGRSHVTSAVALIESLKSAAITDIMASAGYLKQSLVLNASSPKKSDEERRAILSQVKGTHFLRDTGTVLLICSVWETWPKPPGRKELQN